MLRRARREPDEGGYMLIMLITTLATLVAAAALSVDIGGWYARASQIQRAADAAALAGVVWMPDLPAAQTAAVAAAARNGFVQGGTITVAVAAVAGNSRQLLVSITDAKAPRHFSRFATGDKSIDRQATAEYVLPVPLGSPKNTFGTGNTLAGADQEKFWAAVNGYCSGHESGDLRLARYESYSTGSSGANCNNGSAQTADYDPAGYLYAIELPQDQLTLKLEVYDGGYNTSGSTPDVSPVSETQAVTTIYQVYGADNTPLDTSDNPLLSTTTIATNALLQKNIWKSLHIWVAPQAGTYYLRVKTQVQTSESRASNGFGLRAYTGLLFGTCTSISGSANYSASCPQIYGVGAISIYANLGATSGTTATFYLAEVVALHAGKTMQLTLFDAGEGAQTIEVLDPNGDPATFDWRTPCNPPTPPTGPCSGSAVTSLDVSGVGSGMAQPYSGLVSTYRYNDRRMILDVRLPVDYVARYGTDTWWQIRYTVGTTATDRTTWSVNILGDPVHLVGDA